MEVDGRTHDMKSPVVEYYSKPEANVIKEASRFIKKEGAKLPGELHKHLLQILESGI